MLTNKSGKSWHAIPVLVGVATGYVVGQSGMGLDVARAEVKESAPREAFQAGSERSETVLREISKILKTMDGRLERIERIAIEKRSTE